MTPEQTIASFLRQFAGEFVANRQRQIINQRLLNTVDLVKSISAKVTADPERGIYFMRVFAREYGRYQDMARRYKRAGGDDMLQALEEWIHREGLSKFGSRLPDSLEGRTGPAIERGIAWGIIRKLRTGQPTKKRGWWNKGKTADINNFYAVLIRAYSEATAIQLKEAFE